MCRKEKSAVTHDSKKSGSRIKAEEGVELEKVGLKIDLLGIRQERRGLTFALIEKKIAVLSSALQSNHGYLFSLRSGG